MNQLAKGRLVALEATADQNWKFIRHVILPSVQILPNYFESGFNDFAFSIEIASWLSRSSWAVVRGEGSSIGGFYEAKQKKAKFAKRKWLGV